MTHAAQDQRIQVLGDKVTVSGPPTDAQPGQKRLDKPLLATRSENTNSRAHEGSTAAGLDHSAARTSCLTTWGLTFDMSGSRRQAQPAGGCPLNGMVR